MFKLFKAAIAATLLFAGAASAAPLTGNFSVQAVNVTGLNSAGSQASMTNFTTQYGALGNRSDDFSYNGTLDFATYNYNDSTTVASWLSSGTGSAVGLAAGLGGAQMSKPDINSGTATTTFFLFTLLDSLGSSDFAIKHDDGVGVFENGSLLGGFLGPNGVRTTNVSGYHGGTLQFLYVATNGDPSVFKVNATTVPVPAALPLLVGGLGMMGFVARRKRSASKA